MAALVTQTANSIGYVEYAYVLQNKLAFALVQNKAGNFVPPSATSFQAAAASADWASAKDFHLVMTDAPGADDYPIAASVFVLMPKAPKAPQRSKTAIKFFRWALENGQQIANDLHYVPLPAALVARIEDYWKGTFPGAS